MFSFKGSVSFTTGGSKRIYCPFIHEKQCCFSGLFSPVVNLPQVVIRQFIRSHYCTVSLSMTKRVQRKYLLFNGAHCNITFCIASNDKNLLLRKFSSCEREFVFNEIVSSGNHIHVQTVNSTNKKRVFIIHASTNSVYNWLSYQFIIFKQKTIWTIVVHKTCCIASMRFNIYYCFNLPLMLHITSNQCQTNTPRAL